MRTSVLQQHEAEEQATLEAVLAFLDSCSGDASHNSTLDDLKCGLAPSADVLSLLSASEQYASGSSSSNSSGKTGVSETNAKPVTTRRRAAKKCKAAVPAFRRLPKLEILELREQMGQLTARLSSLQKRQELRPVAVLGTDGVDSRSSVTRDTRVPRSLVQMSSAELHYATSERAKLEDARALNARLKVAWRRQITLGRMLESAFKKQLTTQTLDTILKADASEPPSLELQDAADHADAVAVRDVVLMFAKLHFCVELLYTQAASSCASISVQNATRVFNTGPSSQETAFGQMLEFTINTPLSCSLTELEGQIWNTFNRTRDAASNPYLMALDFRTYTTTVFESQYTQRFECALGTFNVDTLSVLRKFEEKSRIVIAFSMVGSIVGLNFKFRETGWLLLLDQTKTGCLSSPQPKRVLLQTRYQISPETTLCSAGSGNAKEAAQLQNFILQAHCDLMRSYHLRFQSTFLAMFG